MVLCNTFFALKYKQLSKLVKHKIIGFGQFTKIFSHFYIPIKFYKEFNINRIIENGFFALIFRKSYFLQTTKFPFLKLLRVTLAKLYNWIPKN